MTDSKQVAFVTGAASGIGRGIAEALDSAGWRVIVADINESAAKEVAAGLVESLYLGVDLTSSKSVDDAAETALGESDQIHALVNCAGMDVIKPFLETDEDLWTTLVQLNLMGVFRTTKAFLPHMVEHQYGRIVNIASDAGRIGSSGEAVYSGCKGGVIAFTKTIAREVARSSITANTVCPGPTDTPALRRMVEEGGDKLIQSLTRGIPVGRLGQPSDIASAVTFLVSASAAFITGQTLSVSGGMTMC